MSYDPDRYRVDNQRQYWNDIRNDRITSENWTRMHAVGTDATQDLLRQVAASQPTGAAEPAARAAPRAQPAEPAAAAGAPPRIGWGRLLLAGAVVAAAAAKAALEAYQKHQQSSGAGSSKS